MRVMTICVLIIAIHQAQGQQGTARQPAATGLTPASLSTGGLANEQLIASIYAGNFADIGMERSDVRFMSLYDGYLRAYGRRCDANLPAKKVEIMESVCARQETKIDRFGNRIGTGTCAEYRTQGTGIYADPVLYAAKTQSDNEVGPDAIRQVFKTMAGENPLGTALSTLGATQSIGSDMSTLVRVNACDSPGLKRFQENLMLFALGRQLVRLPGAGNVPASPRSSPEIRSGEQNFTRLVEDLVRDQSRSWVMNRFVSGSVSNVVVSSRDAQGHPAKVTASYLFNGQSRGSVTISFSSGLPECMYFFDFPSMCRAPNRRIVDAYGNGAYRQ